MKWICFSACALAAFRAQALFFGMSDILKWDLVRRGDLYAQFEGAGVAYVDPNRAAPYEADGSFARPYRTIQAAFDAIGSATNGAAYMNPTNRYYRVSVAPGTYVENLDVPYRPHLALDLFSAVVVGNVTRTVPPMPCSDGPYTNMPSRLVIRGDSVRAFHPGSGDSVVGIDGDIVFGGCTSNAWIASWHHLVELNDVGVTGEIRFDTGQLHWTHLVLNRACVGPIICTNSWNGVTLFAHGWGGGHTGIGPPGDGIGPIIGRILPYNLSDVRISGGMNIHPMAVYESKHYCIWNDVRFEATNSVYVATNCGFSVELDTASYNSWIAATDEAGRGGWREGALMRLTDRAPVPSALVWSNATGAVTVTNVNERMATVTGSGAVSVAFEGLREGMPVYTVLGGYTSVAFPAGAHIVGGGAWQTNRMNHFNVWRYGTNLIVNPLTTTPME